MPPAITSIARSQRSRGFTLIELMLAMAVAAVLASIAVPSYRAYALRASVRQAIADISEMQGPIQQFYSNNGRYPNDLAEAGLGAKTDPWGFTYRYLNIADSGSKNPPGARKDKNLHPLNTDYDLYSIGIDGDTAKPVTNPKSKDDVLRASDGTFINLASEY